MNRFKRIINLVYAVCGILALYIIALTLMGNSVFLFMDSNMDSIMDFIGQQGNGATGPLSLCTNNRLRATTGAHV